MTISGQAYLTAIGITGLIAAKDLKISLVLKIIFLIFFVFIFFYFLSLNIFQKISLEYLVDIVNRFSNLENSLYTMTVSDLFFGSLGTREGFISEIGPITYIYLWGIPLFIIFWISIFMLVFRSNMPFIWFIAIFVSSLHYVTIIYIEAQLILAILFIYSLKIEKFANENRKILFSR